MPRKKTVTGAAEGRPRWIPPTCGNSGCRESLVPWDRLDAANAALVFADEWSCPECRDRVYLDTDTFLTILQAEADAYTKLMGLVNAGDETESPPPTRRPRRRTTSRTTRGKKR